MNCSKSLLNSAALCFAALGGSAFAQLRSAELPAGGDLLSYALVDFDREGKLDPALAVRPAEAAKGGGRSIKVFRQGSAPGAFEASAELPVPDDVALWGTGDFLGEPGAEIVFFTGRTALAVPRAGGEPRKLFENEAFLFQAAAPRDLPFWNLIHDLNADGRDDLITPEAEGFGVYLQSEDRSLTRAAAIGGEFDFSSQRGGEILGSASKSASAEGAARRFGFGTDEPAAGGVSIVTRRSLGQIGIGDTNADSLSDLFLMKQGDLLVFRQETGKGFPSEPGLRFPLGPAPKPESWTEPPAPITHGDVDGDGRADFVALQIDAKELTTKALFYRSTDAGAPAQPTQILKVSGLGRESEFADANGDGKLDLVMITISTSKLMSLKAASAEALDVALDLFLFDAKDGMFAARPALQRDLSVALKPELDERQTDTFFAFNGDFDGDGLRDFLAYENRGELRIFKTAARGAGKTNLSLSADPAIRTPLAQPRSIRVADLNADGKSEATADYKDKLVILMAAP